MDHLSQLESQSIFILREAYHAFKNLAMLWSIGKDSTVLLWLSRKAFFGHVPYPLVHIDTSYKIPEMITYRNKLVMDLKLNLIIGQNKNALASRKTFPDGVVDRLQCCRLLKTEALNQTLSGKGDRYYLNHVTGKTELSNHREPFTGVIVGARSDEEGSRSKERYFSPRGIENNWEISEQPPEFWNQFNTEFRPGSHVRVHPLLDWTELNIWEYIQRENIPVVPLYFNRGDNKRYRSLGCYPCTQPIESPSRDVQEIIAELKTGKLSKIPERSGRAQDKDDGGGLETLRKEGYM